jgi:hypothetical protein
MWSLNPGVFKDAADEAVKEELRNVGWPVYEDYKIRYEDGEAFVVAPISFASFAEPEPMEDRVVQGYRVRKFAGRSPSQDAMTFYAPLRTPELVLDLAELAEKEITPEAVLEWAQVYGLLGFPDEDVVTADEGFAKFNVRRMGRRDSVRSFAEAAGEIRGCLRIYEAITADEDVEIGDLRSATDLLPRKAFLPFGPVERHMGKERPWLLRVLGRMVQMRLDQYCYLQFVAHTYGGEATGRFSLAWGFRGLIGALWLHMAWLLEAEGQNVRRCKLPGCLRVVHFEPGEPPLDPGLKRNARGKYKTRSDREFCKGRGCKQKYHYRKKAGWPGYA